MPNILFASNSISHFPGSEISALAWTYTPTRVPYGIRTPTFTVCSSPKIHFSTTDETWFHFKMGKVQWWINSDEPICEIVDENGDRLISLSGRMSDAHGYKMNVRMDGNNINTARYIPILQNQMRTFDIRLLTTGFICRVELYINEIQIEVVEFPISESVQPAYLWIGGGIGATANINGENFYSEIIVADGDTRNARLDLLRPIAVGAYGNWIGPVSSLADDDPTTGMTTVSAAQSQSTILSAYTGATNISNVVQVTTTVRGLNSPTKLKHLLRMSGVDYLTADFNIPFSKEYQVTDWTQNPATSLPWQASDLVAAEFGFRSIA